MGYLVRAILVIIIVAVVLALAAARHRKRAAEGALIAAGVLTAAPAVSGGAAPAVSGGGGSGQASSRPDPDSLAPVIEPRTDFEQDSLDFLKQISIEPVGHTETVALAESNYDIITTGGAVKGSWTKHMTWASLAKDKQASHEYLCNRKKVSQLDLTKLDWGSVIAQLKDALNSEREYLGVINLDGKGKVPTIVMSEMSTVPQKESWKKGSFASISAGQCARVWSRPAMFAFHTHPADRRGDPMPSPADVANMIHCTGRYRFAAHLVISRYGVIAYSVPEATIKAIHQSETPALSLCILAYNAASSFAASSGWTAHSNTDLLKLYPLHRLSVQVQPSAEMRRENKLNFYNSKFVMPDLELMRILVADIELHSRKAALDINYSRN